jgi:hypothetical protein
MSNGADLGSAAARFERASYFGILGAVQKLLCGMFGAYGSFWGSGIVVRISKFWEYRKEKITDEYQRDKGTRTRT